ncbi:unnamed protein product [Symbiodinium natans]|uniref:Uncharacterized protein n=1 Tax=Symbiodinium natans TaxID=878477 RepID=A0A812HDP0_9DINO|nr:unnamed protein product [Symbiodinium natans]
MELGWSFKFPHHESARPRASARSQPRLRTRGGFVGSGGALVLARHLALAYGRACKVRCGASGASRAGFKVNTKYKGAVSYGTVSKEELEEAARIRSEYSAERPEQAKSALPAAKKRLLLKRLQQPGQAKTGYGPAIAQLMREAKPPDSDSAEAKEDEADGNENSAPGSDEAPKDQADGQNSTSSQAPESGEAQKGSESSESSESSTDFPGLADTVLRRRAVCLESWEGWPAAMALSAAQRIAENPRGSAAASIQAAVRALSTAGEHVPAAELLLTLRDGGVDREVLERRLNVQAASALFEEVAVRSGLELQAAGYLDDAWEALMAASAQPRLSRFLRRPTLKALAAVSERLANNSSSNPRAQVRYIRGALDAEVVLQGLSRDRREAGDAQLFPE